MPDRTLPVFEDAPIRVLAPCGHPCWWGLDKNGVDALGSPDECIFKWLHSQDPDHCDGQPARCVCSGHIEAEREETGIQRCLKCGGIVFNPKTDGAV